MKVRELLFISIAVGAILLNLRGCNNNGTAGIIHSDTVFLSTTTYDTVYIPKTVYKDTTIYVPTAIEEEVVEEDTFRTYSDTVQWEPQFKGYYRAKVNGSLVNISLGYQDDRPERVITKTVENTTTITNTVRPRGLYLGAALSVDGFGPQVNYINRQKFNFGYSYVNKSHRLSVSYKIF